MWRLLFAVVAVALTVTVAAQASPGSAPAWVTLSSGGSVPVTGGGRASAVIIGSRTALGRYDPVALEVGHAGCCDWQQSFNWRRDAVLLVVACDQAAVPEIVNLHRQRTLLRVTIAAPAAGSTVVGPTWTALRVPRQLLGRPLPRRIEVLTAQAR